jgi:hypothetical protein
VKRSRTIKWNLLAWPRRAICFARHRKSSDYLRNTSLIGSIAHRPNKASPRRRRGDALVFGNDCRTARSGAGAESQACQPLTPWQKSLSRHVAHGANEDPDSAHWQPSNLGHRNRSLDRNTAGNSKPAHATATPQSDVTTATPPNALAMSKKRNRPPCLRST